MVIRKIKSDQAQVLVQEFDEELTELGVGPGTKEYQNIVELIHLAFERGYEQAGIHFVNTGKLSDGSDRIRCLLCDSLTLHFSLYLPFDKNEPAIVLACCSQHVKKEYAEEVVAVMLRGAEEKEKLL